MKQGATQCYQCIFCGGGVPLDNSFQFLRGAPAEFGNLDSSACVKFWLQATNNPSKQIYLLGCSESLDLRVCYGCSLCPGNVQTFIPRDEEIQVGRIGQEHQRSHGSCVSLTKQWAILLLKATLHTHTHTHTQTPTHTHHTNTERETHTHHTDTQKHTYTTHTHTHTHTHTYHTTQTHTHTKHLRIKEEKNPKQEWVGSLPILALSFHKSSCFFPLPDSLFVSGRRET